MNKKKLITELDLIGVNANLYSLEGALIPDCIILYHSYKKWEVFYYDERGGRNDEKNFDSEGEACNYIYNLFKEAKEIEEKYLK